MTPQSKTTDELIDAIEAAVEIAMGECDQAEVFAALPLLAELRERVAALPPQPQEK